MPCRAPALLLTLSCAFVAAFACGPGDERKGGAEGIADAFNDLAEHECHCLAEASGLGSEVEDACRDQIGDIDEFFPADCIEGVIDRNPEARPAYDCAADITYDYVECLVGEGCEEMFQCSGGDAIPQGWVCDGSEDCSGGEDESGDCMTFLCDDGTEIGGNERCDGFEDCAGAEDEPADCPDTCDSILESAITQCPQPPEDISEEIEACFPSFQCDDGSELPEDFACDGEADCAGGEDEAGCARASERPLDLRRRAALKAKKRLDARTLRAR